MSTKNIITNDILHSPFLKVIISGGGTGGHIYPAVSIANALRQRFPDVSILFVGAEGRMEMEKVPAAGYSIIGLPVAGIQRKLSWKNLAVPFKFWKSVRKAAKIITDFQPNVVVGVGGYASGPVLWAAQRKGIPTLIQEQNSYAGVTNKMLAKRAARICVAYDGMEQFFPKEKIVITGNPVRQDLYNNNALRDEAARFFGIDPVKKTVLIIGGSLGARTLNQAMTNALPELMNGDTQFVWQTGKYYFENVKAALPEHCGHIKAFDFIYRMDYAFAVADVVISRAGAGTISELCLAAKPCVFVPSPNVSEDHQTKNAQALVSKDAALMVADAEAKTQLLPTVLDLLNNEQKRTAMKKHISKLAKPNAANDIVDEIAGLANEAKDKNQQKEQR